MKTFLDFGTNYFGGLNQFIRMLSIDQSWNVHCFEADPYIFAKSHGSQNYDKLFHHFTHQNVAVFDKDCSVTFNCVKSVRLCNEPGFADGVYLGDFGGSSLIDRRAEVGSNTVNEVSSVTVRGIDVNRILDELVERDPSCSIYIKCDIEGAEYAVLSRLLSSEHLSRINVIYVEWHSRFFAEKAELMRVREVALKELISSHGVMMRDWH